MLPRTRGGDSAGDCRRLRPCPTDEFRRRPRSRTTCGARWRSVSRESSEARARGPERSPNRKRRERDRIEARPARMDSLPALSLHCRRRIPTHSATREGSIGARRTATPATAKQRPAQGAMVSDPLPGLHPQRCADTARPPRRERTEDRPCSSRSPPPMRPASAPAVSSSACSKDGAPRPRTRRSTLRAAASSMRSRARRGSGARPAGSSGSTRSTA